VSDAVRIPVIASGGVGNLSIWRRGRVRGPRRRGAGGEHLPFRQHTVREAKEEVIMAAKDGDRLHIVREVTDLWFHSMILLAQFGIGVDDVMVEFRRREGISGIDEKNSRTPG
jgi:hypothetical protein